MDVWTQKIPDFGKYYDFEKHLLGEEFTVHTLALLV